MMLSYDQTLADNLLVTFLCLKQCMLCIHSKYIYWINNRIININLIIHENGQFYIVFVHSGWSIYNQK